jgi:hypothetical protein
VLQQGLQEGNDIRRRHQCWKKCTRTYVLNLPEHLVTSRNFDDASKKERGTECGTDRATTAGPEQGWAGFSPRNFPIAEGQGASSAPARPARSMEHQEPDDLGWAPPWRPRRQRGTQTAKRREPPRVAGRPRPQKGAASAGSTASRALAVRLGPAGHPPPPRGAAMARTTVSRAPAARPCPRGHPPPEGKRVGAAMPVVVMPTPQRQPPRSWAGGARSGHGEHGSGPPAT